MPELPLRVVRNFRVVLFLLFPLECVGFVAYAIESYHTGTILRTINSGRNWTKVAETNKYLEAIAFRGDVHLFKRNL